MLPLSSVTFAFSRIIDCNHLQVETILAQFRSEWLKTVMDLFGDNVIIPLSTGKAF